MPGDNCCIVGCGSCRRHKGIGIFKVPTEAADKEWRDKWLGEIKKLEQLIKSFKSKQMATMSTHVKNTLKKKILKSVSIFELSSSNHLFFVNIICFEKFERFSGF